MLGQMSRGELMGAVVAVNGESGRDEQASVAHDKLRPEVLLMEGLV